MKKALLILLTLAGCSAPPGEQAGGPDAPGWTGRTHVIGSNSTVAGDTDATYIQQKWGVGRGR